MKKKIIYGLLFAVAMVTASSSFVSCKDYEGDDYAKLTEDNAYLEDYLKAQIAAMQTAITNCGTNCATARTALENALKQWADGKFLTDQSLAGYATEAWVQSQGYLTAHQDLSAYATQAWVAEQIGTNGQSVADYVAAQLGNLSTNSDLPTILSEYAKSADLSEFLKAGDLEGYLKAADLEGYLKAADLEGYAKLTDLQDLYNKWAIRGDSVKAAYTWASYSYQRLAAIDSIASVSYVNDTVNGLRKEIVDSIANLRNEAYQNYLDAKAIADSARFIADSALVTGLAALDSAAANKVRIDALDAAYKAADELLQAQIDTLKNRVTDCEEAISKIASALTKEVTGIEIQGTYNDIFGYFALPVGIQSNMLAAYWGNFDALVAFPVGDGAESAEWVGGVAKATSAELAAIGFTQETYAPGLVFDESEGNAGKVYLTVNPSNVDFTGKDISLRTSDNMLSTVTLGELTPSTERLMWGFTRANSENSFYEATATIKKEDATKNSLVFDLASVKDAVKSVLNNWREPSKIDKSALANAVYKNVQQSLPRLGVQATWVDEITGENKTYVSKYDLGAFTYKPLGFDFLYGSDFSTYVEKVKSKVDGKVHAVESELKSLLKFDLGFQNLPTSINLSINPATKVMTATVTTDQKLPKSTLFETIKTWLDQLQSVKPAIDSDPTKQPHLVYHYYVLDEASTAVNHVYKQENGENKKAQSSDKLPAGITNNNGDFVEYNYGDVYEMSVDISNVNIVYNLEDLAFSENDFIQVGEQIATAKVDITNFINEMNASIAGVNTDLTNMLTAVNGLQGKIDSKLNQISNMISGYTQRILNVTDKVFGYASSLLKNPNRFLQPLMFATTDAEKVVALSNEKLLPTPIQAGADVALFPTSMTGELVAPAYKKYIAVTSVEGGSVSAAQINAAVEDFNKVVNGNKYNQTSALVFKSDASWKGTTVEILYEALGYNGKVAGRKYYITFK